MSNTLNSSRGCPFCDYPLTNSASTECKGYGRDVKSYWGNKMGHETAAEMMDRELLIQARRKVWMDEEFPFPLRPSRSRIGILAAVTAIGGVILSLSNLWLGVVLVFLGAAIFSLLEVSYRGERAEYQMAETDYEKYQKYMVKKHYIKTNEKK